MRYLLIVALAPTYLLTTGCSKEADAQPLAPRYTIEAIEVTGPTIVQQQLLPRDGHRRLRGTFRIRTAQLNERGIVSEGLGGACLVTQWPGQAKACRLDSECDLPGGSGIAAAAEPWHGYCVPGNTFDDAKTGSCWVKPSDDYCKKGVNVGEHSTPLVDVEQVYARAKASPVKFRVLACLNGLTPDGSKPCAAGERMNALTAPKTVP